MCENDVVEALITEAYIIKEAQRKILEYDEKFYSMIEKFYGKRSKTEK